MSVLRIKDRESFPPMEDNLSTLREEVRRALR